MHLFPYRHTASYIAIVAAALSVLLGAMVLVGWYSHNVSLIQVNPAFVPMQYNTALGFALGGLGLLALVWSQTRVVIPLGATVLIIGVLTLIEYTFAVDLQIDQLFIEHYILIETSHPGRMAPNTALCFSLTGLALLIACLKLDYKQTVWVSTPGAMVIALGTVALSGYLTGIEAAYGWGQLTRMAIHTSAGFIALGIGLTAYAWHKSKKTNVEMPYWLATFVGIGSMTITISLWQALDATEHHLPAEVVSVSAMHADEGMLIFGILLTAALVLAIRFAEASSKQLHIATLAKKQLLNSEAFTRAIVETAADGVISIDANGIIETFNPAAESIFGYTADEIIGNKVNMLMPEPHRSRHDGYLKHYLETGEAKMLGTGRRELTGRRKDGSLFSLEISLAAMAAGDQQKFTGIIRDITERILMQERIEKMAYFDILTGLPNRSLHYDRLKQSLAHARRNKKNIAVLFLDLDYFKPINDELGHEYGDQALIEVSKRLQKCIRETDTASRIGGDEFCVILESLDAEDAACNIAEKIIAAISQPMFLNGIKCSLGCSIGICIADQACKDAESIMVASDSAMYQAKKDGRNCYHIYQG